MPNGIDFVEDTAPAENAIDFQADEEVAPPAAQTARVLPPNFQFKLTPYQQTQISPEMTGAMAGATAMGPFGPVSPEETARIPEIGQIPSGLVRGGVEAANLFARKVRDLASEAAGGKRYEPPPIFGEPPEETEQRRKYPLGAPGVPLYQPQTATPSDVQRWASEASTPDQLLTLPLGTTRAGAQILLASMLPDVAKQVTDITSGEGSAQDKLERARDLVVPAVIGLLASRPEGTTLAPGRLPPRIGTIEPPPVPIEAVPLPPITGRALPGLPEGAPSPNIPPVPTAPVPPREAFPPGPAPRYAPELQWAFRPDVPPGAAPREAVPPREAFPPGPAPTEPVPPRPPEPPPAPALPAPETPIITPGSPAAAKPEVAQLADPETNIGRNPYGDPSGTTYHATPEDWAKWQDIEARFKNQGNLPPKERFQVWSEREAMRNKYGGMHPEPPKPAAPAAPAPKTAADFAALPPEQFNAWKKSVNYADGTAGQVTADFKPEDIPTLEKARDEQRAIVDRLQKDLERATTQKNQAEQERIFNLISSHGLKAQTLNEFVRAIRARTPAAAPVGETPPPTPTPGEATPEPPKTIEQTPIAGKTLAEWEAVKDASQLPKGDQRAALAKWLAVPNQPSRILQALANKKRTREIHAPPAPIEEVAPPTPAPPAEAPPTETKPAEPETKPVAPETKPEQPQPYPGEWWNIDLNRQLEVYAGRPSSKASQNAPSQEARFGPASYWTPEKSAAAEYAKFRGEGASVTRRTVKLSDRRVLNIERPDETDPRFAKFLEQFGLTTEEWNEVKPHVSLEKWIGRIAPAKNTFFPARDIGKAAKAAGYDTIIAHNEGPGMPAHTEIVLLDEPAISAPETKPPVSETPAAPAAPELVRGLIDRAMVLVRSKELSSLEKSALSQAIEAARQGDKSHLAALVDALSEAPEKAKKQRLGRGLTAKTRFENETQLSGPDILSWIKDNMKLLSRSGAKTAWTPEKYEQNKSLWDDAPTQLAGPHHNIIYAANGFAPDRVAQAAFNDGALKEPSVNALWQAIEAASNKRKSSVAAEALASKWLAEHEKEVENWEKATKPQSKGDIELTTEELGVGDLMELEGERIEVTARNPETGELTLKDGRKFGVQTLAEGKKIYVEKFEPASDTETEFLPPEQAQPAAEPPKLRTGEKQTGELFQGADQPFNLMGEAGTDAERIAREKSEADRKAKEAEEFAKKNQQELLPPPEAAGPGSIGPGAAASAEFTARENRRRLLADFTERLFGSRAGEAVDAFLRKMAGEAVPKTMSLSGESGNKMVRFAAANNAAPHIARSLTLEVLGDNFKNAEFRERLGAVLVEDRLRAIRKGLEDAAGREANPAKKQELLNQAHDVNSLVGPDKPFATEADFLNAIDDPEIAKAIKAHKQGPQVEAEHFHTEADGQLAGPGVHTGAFVNLAPIFEDRPEMIFRGARKGDYTRPFKRKSVFSRTAKGTAAKYELDYGTLAERMIRGNYEEFTKRQLYDQLVADNLAVIRPPGQPAPKFDGRPAEKFQIKRQTLITPNGAIPQYENLWVHPDVAPELRQAENLGSPVSSIALARVADVLNRIQLAGPTDAVWHIANMMSTIAGSQGGKTFLADLARKVPLVNVIDATVRVTQAAKKILANDPDVMRQISELAEIGQVRPERPGGGATSRIINLLDKAGRVVRDDMYKNLVNRGLVEASEAGRREFVGQLGQYNPRLMGQIESFFKEAGFSPFIVAGRNFNRAALRRLTLSPGVRAANLTSALQMRALEATGVVATLVAVPSIINMMTTGKPGGRDPSIPFGAIDTGKDDKNGKHIYIDPAQWIGLRRGMRLTGINAVVEGMRRGTPIRQIEKRAGQDIIGALVHPWAGPVVQLPFITATGYTTSGFKESKDPGDYWQNFKAALENINPVVHGWFQKQPGTGVAGGLESSATSLLSAIGVKTRAPATATSQVHDLAQTWASKSDDPKIRSEYEQHVKESFSSEYQDLRSALLRNDTAGARDAYRQLRDKGKKPATIRQTLQHPHPFTGSARTEARFRQSLTPEQRETYNKALEERRQLYHRFQQMLQSERKPDASNQ